MYRFTLDDVRYLTSADGFAALDAANRLPLNDSSLLADLTTLRRQVGEQAAAVAETVRLRRKAVPRLGEEAARWLFTDEALQQASPAAVARHRARRLAGIDVHDLTCSIGADLAALAAVGIALGSDLDPVRLAMARHNLAGSGAVLVQADALTRSSRGLLSYADPARRESGRRITTADTLPSLADLDRVHGDRPPVLRMPPGIDYDALARPGEVEIVSLDGTVREAVLWPAELATTQRRATVLTDGLVREQLTSEEPDEVVCTGVGDWIVDPDPAVVRAHLVRHWAFRHSLTQLDPHLAYLTGPVPPKSERAFQVLDHAPYSERTVREWLRRDRIGTLEIKQRGTPVVPDELRLRLRKAMIGPTTAAATLVIARVGRQAMAYWCRARPADR